MTRQDRLDRIRAIEREYLVARLAIEALRRELDRDPNLLHVGKLRPADEKAFRENLEATYLLRLFAEFEIGLRSWWRDGLKRASQPPTYQLIKNVATRRNIPRDDADDV